MDNSDDDNYNHHYSRDYDYTTAYNDEYTTAKSYNSAAAFVNASVNASVAGSRQYKHIAQGRETDVMPAKSDELLKCPGCLTRTANSMSCMEKANLAAELNGLRYATQLAIDDMWQQFNKPPASVTKSRSTKVMHCCSTCTRTRRSPAATSTKSIGHRPRCRRNQSASAAGLVVQASMTSHVSCYAFYV